MRGEGGGEGRGWMKLIMVTGANLDTSGLLLEGTCVVSATTPRTSLLSPFAPCPFPIPHSYVSFHPVMYHVCNTYVKLTLHS